MRSDDQDEAYREAATRFGGAIERLARGYEADPELARDLVQDIHTQLWRSFAYFEGQCAIKSWVYRIAHNVGVTHVQKALRTKPAHGLVDLAELDLLAAEDDPERDVDADRIRRRLFAAIHRLKPGDRQVMLLYLEELSAAEIAEVTGLSPGAIATRISRLKTALATGFLSQEVLS